MNRGAPSGPLLIVISRARLDALRQHAGLRYRLVATPRPRASALSNGDARPGLLRGESLQPSEEGLGFFVSGFGINQPTLIADRLSHLLGAPACGRQMRQFARAGSVF